MKKLNYFRQATITAMFLLVAVFCQSQIKIDNSFLTLANDSLIKTITPFSGITFGYHKTGKLDTVKAVLLITECDDCQSKSVTGYAVRELSTYFGDKMPTYPATDYSDTWEIKSYLDNRKKPFLSNVTIWDCRIK